MRAHGLVCRVRRKKKYNSYRTEVGKVAPNVFDRDFSAGAPNQKWATAVTEFRVGDQKLYLSPVMDLFDRQIISYAVGTSPNLQLANSSLRAAIASLGDGQTRMVYSDREFHHQNLFSQHLLADSVANQAMSRKGNCFDNALSNYVIGSAATTFATDNERDGPIDPDIAPAYAQLHAHHNIDPEIILTTGLAALHKQTTMTNDRDEPRC